MLVRDLNERGLGSGRVPTWEDSIPSSFFVLAAFCVSATHVCGSCSRTTGKGTGVSLTNSSSGLTGRFLLALLVVLVESQSEASVRIRS